VGDYPFAKVSDISRAVAESGGRLSTAANYADVADLKALRAKPVPAGSTVFAKIGEALRLNRRAIAEVDVILDNNCMALSPAMDRVIPRYLFWFMQTVDLSPFAV
jgi:type I restriction enzyme S subunit